MIEEILKELTAIREENNLTYQLIIKKLDDTIELLKRIDLHLTPVTLPVEIKEEKEDRSVDLLEDIKDLLVKIEKIEAYRRKS